MSGTKQAQKVPKWVQKIYVRLKLKLENVDPISSPRNN